MKKRVSAVFHSNFTKAWTRHKTIVWVGAAYAGVCLTQASLLDGRWQDILGFAAGSTMFVVTLFIFFLFFAYTGISLWALYSAKFNKKSFIKLLGDTLEKYVKGERFAHGVVGLLVCYFTTFFLIQKGIIRFLNPYHWDPVFAKWDSWIHGGVYPHALLQTLFSSEVFLKVFQYSYFLWFLFLYAIIIFNLFFDRKIHRRFRFLWAFFLSWVLIGGVGATVFSSVGPVFWGTFYPDLSNPYADLVELVLSKSESIPGIIRANAKIIVWTQGRELIPPNAVSAMPSMHIAVCWLGTLYAKEIDHRAFSASLLYTALVFMAAVYFGYHYAIDGYVSIAIVTMLWFATGKSVRHSLKDVLGQ